MKNNQKSAPEIRKLSEDLKEFRHNIVGETVTIDELIYLMEERGIAMLLFMLALPMGLPIPVPPGVNVALAMPLLLLTAQQAIGVDKVWLPKKMRERAVPRQKLEAFFDKILPWIERIEFFMRPRLKFLTHRLIKRIVGVCGFIMALTVCIPLPLTNSAPSFGIACMSMGLLMRDVIAVLAGICVGLGWIALLIFAGEAGIDFLIGIINGEA
jgi:hypothetical protein